MNTKVLEAKKQNLIVRISKLDREEAVLEVERVVDLVEKHPTKKQLEILKKLAKPMRKKLDINELIKEQSWKPSTPEEINEIIKDFDWQISDEEFMRLLKDI